MTSPSVQGNLATFVLAVHSADNFLIHLAMARVMESPQCVVVKKDMVVWGLGAEKHLSWPKMETGYDQDKMASPWSLQF